MKIFVIPDTQVKPGVQIKHLKAAGNYIVEKKPDVVVHLGDHWDMPSLSSYDKGKKSYEGRRYRKDIEAGIRGMEALFSGLNEYNANRAKNKEKKYKPRMVILTGNHEQRIERAVESEALLEGTIGYDDLKREQFGWEVVPFLQPIDIGGILFCHYFINTNSLVRNPLGGTIDNKLRAIGQSFCMGHQQGLQVGMRYLNKGTAIRGIVAGSYYMHDEEYMGPQGNFHWRGCLMLHGVKDGNYSLCEVDMNYLLKEYL